MMQYTDLLLVLAAMLLTLFVRTLPRLYSSEINKEENRFLQLVTLGEDEAGSKKPLTALQVNPSSTKALPLVPLLPTPLSPSQTEEFNLPESRLPSVDSLSSSPAVSCTFATPTLSLESELALFLPRKVTKSSHVRIVRQLALLLTPSLTSEILPPLENVHQALTTLTNTHLPGNEYLTYLLKKVTSKTATRASMIQHVSAVKEYLEFLVNDKDTIPTFQDLIKQYMNRLKRLREILERSYASTELKRREVKIVRRDPRWRGVWETVKGLKEMWKQVDESIEEAVKANHFLAEEKCRLSIKNLTNVASLVKHAYVTRQFVVEVNTPSSTERTVHRRSRSWNDGGVNVVAPASVWTEISAY